MVLALCLAIIVLGRSVVVSSAAGIVVELQALAFADSGIQKNLYNY